MRVPRWLSLIALAGALAGCASRDAVHTRAGTPVVVAVAPPEIPALLARGHARATLVNVWATWCEPCKEEFPALLKVASRRSADGVRLVLVSADFPDQLPAIRQFLAARGVSDTTYLKSGDDMTFINTMDSRWSGALPATFVYDAKLHLVSFWEGKADSSRFETALNRALAPATATEDSHP